MTERPGAVTHKGRPLTVMGDKLKPGDKAPDFELATGLFSLEKFTLADTGPKVRLFNVVPSLNTGICDAQTKRFNEELAQYGDKVEGYTISVDLPVAQANWCTASGVDRLKMLSDYRSMSFGDAYGTHVKEVRVEQRSIFIVDADGVIRYIEYVPEISQHPNYDAALAALKEVVG
ncbi:MAG: thiol peroxidase [Anaerolineales bacterium]|nr:thiol peroxidase [Anaerolineales bacterium]